MDVLLGACVCLNARVCLCQCLYVSMHAYSHVNACMRLCNEHVKVREREREIEIESACSCVYVCVCVHACVCVHS